MRKQLLSNCKITLKRPRNWVQVLKIDKLALSESPNLSLNLNFRSHISTFPAENTPKIGHLRKKNYALTTSGQLQNNFGIAQKMSFSPTKLSKHGCRFSPKRSLLG